MRAQSLLTLFERELNKLKDEIGAYPDDDSLWIIEKNILNSGGNLCAHLCGNLRHFIGTILGNDGYIRNRDLEFAVKGLDRKELQEEVDNTIKAIQKVLGEMTDEELEKEYPVKGPLPEGTKTATMLQHLHGHLNYHLGQVNYHRRLLT